MPQKVIRFKGIDRKVNEFQASGECEELINIRPLPSGGLSTVKPKAIVEADVSYDKVYEHKWGSHCNYIASDEGYVFWINSEDESEITDSFSGSDVEFSSVGNILVVYDKKENRQEVYKYEDGSYSRYYLSLPTLIEANAVVNYKPNDTTTAVIKHIVKSDGDAYTIPSKILYDSALSDCVAEFYYKNPSGLCGAVVFGCTFELEDGNEIWSNAFVLADVTKAKNYVTPTNVNNDEYYIKVTGAEKVYYELQFDTNVPFHNVRKINIYASRPIFPYEFDRMGVGSNGYEVPLFKRIPLKNTDLASQLMYYQKSITPDKHNAIVELNFSKSQAGEKILNVDAGCIERVGKTVVYNNRFHCFQSQSNHVIQKVTQSYYANGETNIPEWMAYIETKDGWIILDKVHKFRETEAQDFIYPLAGIKRLAFVKGNRQSLQYTDMFYVEMSDSTAYNYSYAFDVTPKIESASRFYEIVSSYGQDIKNKVNNGFDKTFPMDEEYNVINVSAPFNPYVFPVKNSYSFGGEILDISTAYNPITATQIGQYPLTVFTSNGIYAMEQGGGDVLYNSILPLQPHIISGKACATPYGIFFASAGRLYVLSGREVADISLPLDGIQDDDLKLNGSYQALLQSEDGKFHYFWSMLTHIPLPTFVEEAVLTYDQLHNEVYISSLDNRESCSYVFNINTKQYHRISKRYLTSYNGARQVIEIDRNTKNLVDLYSESEGKQHILLQSRPMTLDAFYSHIQRTILLVDTELEDSDNLCLSVFASDNLNDWKCIISSQKRNVVLRQIRTNKSARSYKDYIILISGTVSTATDISDLLADYTTVNRRLG